MASRDPDQLVVAGTGDIYVAPVGTALPTTEATTLNAAFVKLGYTSEEGVTFQSSVEVQEFKAWQSLTPVRRERTGREDTVSFQLEQWNGDNFELAFGGGEVTEVSAGHYKYTPPLDSDALAENCIVVDFADGDKAYRWILERGSITEGVETNITRSDLALLPIGFKLLTPDAGGAPWQLLTNDPAFNPAAS